MNRQELLEQSDSVSWQELLEFVRSSFCQAGIEEYETDSWLMLSYYFDLSKSSYYLKRRQAAGCSREQLTAFLSMAEKRCSRVPLQYLTGQQCFMGLEFQVTPAVLIPRQDTEVLVETVLQYSRQNPSQTLLDVCTGSGCIAISLAWHGEYQQVDAADLSPEALEVARANNQKLGTAVHFYQGDLLEPVQKKYDIIVSNPPYIEEDVIAGLEPEVRDHEPHLALSGGADGLAVYRRLIQQAPEYLREGGALFVEIGYQQWEPVRRLFLENGFQEPVLVKDLAGLDRVVWARRNK